MTLAQFPEFGFFVQNSPIGAKNERISMKLSKAMAWGIIFIMCLNSMSLHFDENRTLATQIGTLGTSVGQFAFPVIITPLVAAYSLKVWIPHLRL